MAVGRDHGKQAGKMSSEAKPALPSSSASRQPTWSFKIQNFSTPQTYAAKSAADSKVHTPTTAPTATASSTAPQTPNDALNVQRKPSGSTRKRRRLDKEEEEIKNEIAASVSANLELDQIMTLYPDTDQPFENRMDVVRRLLPYHIYQHPQHDLDEMRGIKGKARATEVDLLREEVNDTKFALECHKRLRSLEQRMRKTLLKPGQSVTPLDQAILVERLMLESEHSESSALEHELSSARTELDKILRAQRMAKSAAIRTTLGTSNTTAVNGTNTAQSPTSSYYGYTTPTFNTTSTPNYSNYYSSYTYPYAQPFILGTSYSSTTKTGSSSIPGVSSFPSGAATQTARPVSNRSTGQASSIPASSPAPPPVAIPLQLPVTSLPALQSLGILPVPKSSLPATSNPQPAAVLLGTSNNGNMLSLEINAALLQPPQMSGLAILLSSLVKMSGGQNATGQTTGQTQNANSGAAAQSMAATGSAVQSVSDAEGKAVNGDTK